MLVTGLADAYSWVAMFFAVLPLFFIFKMQKREHSWIRVIFVTILFPTLGVMLSDIGDRFFNAGRISIFDLILPPLGILLAILLNFTFTWRMQQRERSWIISVAAIYPF